MAYINTFEQLLLRNIIIQKFDLEEPLLDKNFRDIEDDLNLDNRTLKRLCLSTVRNGKLTCKDNTLDKLVSNLNIRPEIKSWMNFKARYSPPKDIINERVDPIPNKDFEKLSPEWQNRIQLAVNEILKSIYPDNITNEIEWKSDSSKATIPLIIDKLELYFNSLWYFYFYHEENFTTPKIGRAILKIGENQNEVSLINFKDSESNDYSGSVSLDKSQIVLVFDLKTTKTREKWLHIKVSINTGNLPEIALGHYSNLGDGGITLVSGTVVLEHMPSGDLDNLKAKPISVFDEEFSQIHPSIQKYLRDKKFNFQKAKAQIFTKEKLLKFVGDYPIMRQKKLERIRLHPQMKVVISCPQTHLKLKRFEEYEAPCFEFATLLKEKLDFDVVHFPSKNYNGGSAKRARSFSYFLDRIMDCDILIVFYFDNVPSMCLMELAWAAEHNKEAYIFTVDYNMIPRVFQYQKPSSVQIFPGHASPQDAFNYINMEINYLFKNYIPNN